MNESSIDQVLHDPALRGSRVLAGELPLRRPTAVRIVEALDDLPALPQDSVAIFGREATRATSGYRIDVTLREVAERQVVGLVLTGPYAPDSLGATSTALARKAGTIVLAAPADRDLAELAVAWQAAIDGDADEALRRLGAVLVNLERTAADAAPGDTEPLRLGASEALGSPVELREARPGEPWSPVLVDGQAVASISTSSPSGHLTTAARLALVLTATAMGRSLEAAVRAEEAPIRSRGAVLSELLVASEGHATGLVTRARRLGVPVDGWHRALLLQIRVGKEAPGYDLLDALGRYALRVTSAGPHQWHLARTGDAVVLLQTWRQEPHPSTSRTGVDIARDVIQATSAQFTQVQLRCGVGTPHEGASGLRATVAEARAALASDVKRQVAAFDQAGLSSMLLEWYGTDTARQAVKDLLEPLDRLGGERARTAIATLQAYLDEQGSLQRAAERLHLHRNAVAYRMKRIAEVLRADLDDPEERLALQLACRARLFR